VYRLRPETILSRMKSFNRLGRNGTAIKMLLKRANRLSSPMDFLFIPNGLKFMHNIL